MSNSDIWSFRYEPKKFKDIILNENIKPILKKIIVEKPNLMLIGPPGVGKGLFTRIFLKESGLDYMWLNSSDETGIDVIRAKVKSFATAMGLTELKVVVLNEADSLSRGPQGAQKMLKQLMEDVHKITRFVFISNDESLMMTEIMSRCQVIHIDNPPAKEIFYFVSNILKKERVKFNKVKVISIIKKCYPDIRSTIISLQKNTIDGKLVGDETIHEPVLNAILNLVKEKNLGGLRTELRSNAINYSILYKYLFDNINNFKSPGDGIILVGDHSFRDVSLHQNLKEINFVTMVVKMIRDKVV